MNRGPLIALLVVLVIVLVGLASWYFFIREEEKETSPTPTLVQAPAPLQQPQDQTPPQAPISLAGKTYALGEYALRFNTDGTTVTIFNNNPPAYCGSETRTYTVKKPNDMIDITDVPLNFRYNSDRDTVDLVGDRIGLRDPPYFLVQYSLSRRDSFVPTSCSPDGYSPSQGPSASPLESPSGPSGPSSRCLDFTDNILARITGAVDIESSGTVIIYPITPTKAGLDRSTINWTIESTDGAYRENGTMTSPVLVKLPSSQNSYFKVPVNTLLDPNNQYNIRFTICGTTYLYSSVTSSTSGTRATIAS